MAEYTYPAVFHRNGDGTFTVSFPDLPGCITEGKTIGNAIYMAQSALTQWTAFLTDSKEPLPEASALGDILCDEGEFVNLVCATVRDGRAVKRTISLPKWMDDAAIENGLSLSRVLQDALKDRLHIN